MTRCSPRRSAGSKVALGFSSLARRAAASGSRPRAGFAISGSDPAPNLPPFCGRRGAAAAAGRRGGGARQPQPRARGLGAAWCGACRCCGRDGTALYPGAVDRGAAAGARGRHASWRSAIRAATTRSRRCASAAFTVPTTAGGDAGALRPAPDDPAKVISAGAIARRRLRGAAPTDRRAHRPDRHLGERPARPPRDAARGNRAGRARSTRR